MKRTLITIIFILLITPYSLADQEAGNRTYVQSSDYGQFYVKSVPKEQYGLAGTTRVYQVQNTDDILLYTYDWYSPEIYVYGFTAGPTVYIIQFGPWHRGHQANSEDLAIALYKNDQLLKNYSTLDIAGEETNVSASVSHYTIFKKKLGFRRPWGNQIIFDVELHNGNMLSFNTDTGGIISQEEERLGMKFYEVREKISQIKWKWYELNKDKIKDINNYEITEEELRNIDSKNYPDPPNGYKIIPRKMWDQAEIIKL